MNPLKNAGLRVGTVAIAALLSLGAEIAVAEPKTPPTTPQTPEGHQTEGDRQLSLASQRLDEAENAETSAKQREAYLAAERHSERAVELLPESADAHFLHFAARGRLAQMQGLALGAVQLPSLQRELDLVLELNPDHADALGSRGGMLVKLPFLLGGNVPEGIRLLRRALELDPQSIGKRLELAEAYNIDEKTVQAASMVAEARKLADASGSTREQESVRKFAEALQKSCSGCAVEILAR